MPDASFAGQQETFLNVQGFDAVLVAVKHVFASLFNDRAISYRVHQGYDHRGWRSPPGCKDGPFRSGLVRRDVLYRYRIRF